MLSLSLSVDQDALRLFIADVRTGGNLLRLWRAGGGGRFALVCLLVSSGALEKCVCFVSSGAWEKCSCRVFTWT